MSTTVVLAWGSMETAIYMPDLGRDSFSASYVNVFYMYARLIGFQ